MTRQEHLDWAKRRAEEYITRGQPGQALSGFISDVSKDMGAGFLYNPNKSAMRILMVDGMDLERRGDIVGLRRWIQGWN